MADWPPPPTPIGSAFLGSLAQIASPAIAVPEWIYVRARFQTFLENLKITPDQAQDGETKHRGVVSSLNRAYWNSSDETANRLLIGSWAKQTRVRPPRDIDILFVLSVEVYWRFQQRIGNRQSQTTFRKSAIISGRQTRSPI